MAIIVGLNEVDIRFKYSEITTPPRVVFSHLGKDVTLEPIKAQAFFECDQDH